MTYMSAFYNSPESANRAVQNLNGMRIGGVNKYVQAYHAYPTESGLKFYKVINGIRRFAECYEIVEAGMPAKKVFGSGQQIFFSNVPYNMSLPDFSKWLTGQGVPLAMVEFAHQRGMCGHGFISVRDDTQVLDIQADLNGQFLDGQQLDIQLSNWYQSSMANALDN